MKRSRLLRFLYVVSISCLAIFVCLNFLCVKFHRTNQNVDDDNSNNNNKGYYALPTAARRSSTRIKSSLPTTTKLTTTTRSLSNDITNSTNNIATSIQRQEENIQHKKEEELTGVLWQSKNFLFATTTAASGKKLSTDGDVVQDTDDNNNNNNNYNNNNNNDNNDVTQYLKSILPPNETSLDGTVCRPKPTYQIRLSVFSVPQEQDDSNVDTITVDAHRQRDWMIQTYDDRGIPKRDGGDIFFVTYTSFTGPNSHERRRQQLWEEQNLYWTKLKMVINETKQQQQQRRQQQQQQKHQRRIRKEQQQPQQQQLLLGPNQHDINYGRLPPTAVALVEDRNDGTYLLKFTRVPFLPPFNNTFMGEDNEEEGMLRIHMEYTCAMGRMTRPSKDAWVNGGYLYSQMFRLQLKLTMVSTKSTTNSSNGEDYDVPFVPYIDEFQVPNSAEVVRDENEVSKEADARPLVTTNGEKVSHRTNNSHVIDLSIYDKIIPFGDSLLNMFVGYRDNIRRFYHSNIVQPKDNYGPFIRYDTIKRAFQLLEQNHHDDLFLGPTNNMKSRQDTTVVTKSTNVTTTDTKNTDEKIALLMGSAAWEMCINEDDAPIQGQYFNKSLTMYRQMIHIARKRYPHVTVLWKSPQAVHITNVDYDTCLSNPKCNTRIRYVSNSISRYLYEQQKRIMYELDVPFLDIWEACYLSPYAHFGVDFQHYHEYYNMLLLDMFYLSPEKKLGPSGSSSAKQPSSFDGNLRSLKKYASQSLLSAYGL